MSTLGVDRASGVEGADSSLSWLYRVGGSAAVILLILFLSGITGMVVAGSQAAIAGGWFSPLQSNWLIVLFNMNAGSSGAQAGSLNVLNAVDLSIMALVCAMFLALYVALRSTSKIWTAIATSLPFLGIPVFVITSMAGRSALFFAVLIISAVMLRSDVFGKATAYVGIVASVLLFFGGDIATVIFTSSGIMAVVIGIGYALWMAWFSLIAVRLFRLGQGKPSLSQSLKASHS